MATKLAEDAKLVEDCPSGWKVCRPKRSQKIKEREREA